VADEAQPKEKTSPALPWCRALEQSAGVPALLLQPQILRADSGAGLPKIRLHDLRHTAATLLLAAGKPAKVVSERLGHSGTAITQDLYQHVTPELEQDAAATAGAAVFGDS
jgi:integrase